MVNYIGVGHICISTMVQQKNIVTDEQKRETLYNKFIQNLSNLDNKYTTGIYRKEQGPLNKYVILIYERVPIAKMTVKTELNDRIEVLNEFVQNLKEKIESIEIYNADHKHRYRFEIKTERFESMVKMRVDEYTHKRAKADIASDYEKIEANE